MCDWDEWRANYLALTFAEQQEFHSEIYAMYPVQQHFDEDQCSEALDMVMPKTVVELGGWDGELAERMLNRHPDIEKWTNVELCKEASLAGAKRHPKYVAEQMTDWYWTRQWKCDMFVASHVIEHLTAEDLQRVIEATDALGMFFDAPLGDHGHEWPGFTGTHILSLGWIGVHTLCSQRGYKLAWARDHETDPTSGGEARACLYLREHYDL